MTNPITKLRDELGMKQAAFAKKLGRTQSTVSRWESGEQMPDPMALHALQKLGLDVAKFLTWQPKKAA